MVRLRLIFLLCFLTLCTSGGAQTILDSLRFENRVWSLKKKALILRELEMTEAQKSSFWPVYESYESATEFVEAEYLFLLCRYKKGSEKYSSSELNELSQRLLENDLQIAKIRKRYFKKFGQAVSPTQASAFMMLDNNFREMIRMQVNDTVPSVKLVSTSDFNQ